MTILTETEPRSDTALKVNGLSKHFGSTQALDNFSFEMRAGEVHALLGGNGSGKSTFIKVLAGVHQAHTGTLEVGGRTIAAADHSPHNARALGLRFVHQDLGIVPELSITDNLALGEGFQTGWAGRIQWRAAHRRAATVLHRFHVDADPAAPAATLSTPERAMLAIARALQRLEDEQRAVLILDEPTASLPPEEATLLLDSISRVASQGHAVLLVTHRLDEARRVAHRITAMRDGRYVGTKPADDLTEAEMVELILGRRLHAPTVLERRSRDGEPVLSVRGLRGAQLRSVDLDVRPGEVLGIAGLLGSGRTELLEFVYGLRHREAGTISFDGRHLRRVNPRRTRAAGVELVPEERQGHAIFPGQSVSENMTAGAMRPYLRGPRLDHARLTKDAVRDVGTFQVKTSSVEAPIDSLSGGNQQKVVLGRCLRRRPRLLLLDEPTQGIDIGAREEIYTLIHQASADGAAVLLVSSEFAELSRLSHRVLVLAGGRIAAEHAQGVTEHVLLESVLVHLSQEKP